MKLKLTTWERTTLVLVLWAPREFAGLREYRVGSKLLDALEMNEDEQAEIEFEELQPGSFQWNGGKDHEWTVELPDSTVDFLRQAFAGYRGWTTLRPDQREKVFALADKLGVD